MYQLKFSSSIEAGLKNFTRNLNADFQNASQQETDGFMEDCARSNIVRAKMILWMSFCMEAVMTFLYIADTYFLRYGKFFPYYIYLYSSMLIFSVIFYSFLVIFRKNYKALFLVEQALILLWNVWGAVFSALDVSNGFSSYLFVQIMIINSLIFRISPKVHCSANIVGYLIYALMVLHANLGLTRSFAELINPFFMTAAACVIVILNHRTKRGAYLNRKLIEAQNKELEFYANNDFLTKIPNRKSIMEYLEQILKSASSSAVCMMTDIDNFKLYNDTYGHITGDRCLIRLSGAMSEFVQKLGGKIGRYGGEEFLIVFENKSESEIVQTADHLLKLIRGLQIPFEVNPVRPVATISIGISVSAPDETSLPAILTRADNALYLAKRQGKNCFVTAPSEPFEK